MRFLAFIAFVALFNAVLIRAQEIPRIHDDRLQLTLFASDPDIVTPIGLATGPDDTVYVVESHTHHPPKDYSGPKTDRILIFQDTNHDGTADHRTVFAEGLTAAMNLTVTANHRVFVVCAREVWELIDKDKDLKSESRRRIIEVKTENNYAHSCLLGITHSHDGWLYLGRGNNGSMAYQIQGTDTTSVSGYGDGGNVTRCKFDGSEVEEFATGFWNLFDLEFDQSGHLLGVDNDPDARGPNRIVHIVPQGDYGYKSMYGGGGNHPYQGWDGALPGTLPYVSATGEAPSGILDARRTSLPSDYEQSLLVTVWNENTIERHQTERQGASLKAKSSVLVTGDQQFRPVALDADSRGNIYITDWVLVDYPNHGRGKIWRLSTKSKTQQLVPQTYAAGRSHGSRAPRLGKASTKQVQQALSSEDPFVVHQAVSNLARQANSRPRAELINHSTASVRLGTLLAMIRSGETPSEASIKALLRDSAPTIRQRTMQWIGEAGMIQYRDDLELSLATAPTTVPLFNTYLATHEVLSPEFISAREAKSQSKASRLPRQLKPEYIKAVIEASHLPDEVRALAVTSYAHSVQSEEQVVTPYLLKLLDNTPVSVQREVIRSLAALSSSSLPQRFLQLASDTGQPIEIRRTALGALERSPLDDVSELIRLTQTNDDQLTLSALRTLASHRGAPGVEKAISRAYVIHRNRGNEALLEQIEDLLYDEPGCCQPRVTLRPNSLEEWQFALRQGGDPKAGENVFYSPRAGCTQCHTIDNRGGKLGPDLSNAGQSVNRQQIIHSILRPSDQFPPQYQAWVVETTDGEEYRGLQLDHKANGALELFTLLGRTERFSADQIDRYYAAPRSLMPDGLEQGLSTSEMRDLVSFLESRK